MQPPMQLLDRGGRAAHPHLDGAVGQVARVAREAEALGFEARAVPKVHALNFSRDAETARGLAHSLTEVLLRRRRRGPGGTVAVRGGRECHRGVVLRLLRRETRAHVFSRLEM